MTKLSDMMLLDLREVTARQTPASQAIPQTQKEGTILNK
jgi:hypothetical protein